MTEPIRVLVVDDQTVVREGLVGLLDLVDGIDVIGAAADGGAALRAIDDISSAGGRVDVVLMDLRMPGMDGIDATRRIVDDHPALRVIALTTYDDDESIVGALSAGAVGYLTKDASAEVIADAIRVVHAGGQLLAPDVRARLIDALAGRRAGPVPPTARPAPPASGVPSARSLGGAGLTPREIEVLRLIAEGCSNSEIGDALHIGRATVKTHVNNLFAKLHVRDRAQAVALAYRSGLVRTDGPPGSAQSST